MYDDMKERHGNNVEVRLGYKSVSDPNALHNVRMDTALKFAFKLYFGRYVDVLASVKAPRALHFLDDYRTHCSPSLVGQSLCRHALCIAA